MRRGGATIKMTRLSRDMVQGPHRIGWLGGEEEGGFYEYECFSMLEAIVDEQLYAGLTFCYYVLLLLLTPVALYF